MAREYFLTPLFFLVLAGCTDSPQRDPVDSRSLEIERQNSGTESLIIGIDAVDERIVWAAGTGGTFLRTVDGGQTWRSGTVPEADSLQFRDVHAVSLDEAYLLSIGPGDASRIYHTTDRGGTWELQFVNDRPDAFFDCFDFWDDGAGVAFSDAVDGSFPIIRRADAGAGWSDVEDPPSAQPNEGGFAASGTCVVTVGDAAVLIGTGNAERARVLRSTDRGRTWQAFDVPVHSGEAAGIATLAFRNAAHGVALGGDIARPDTVTDNVAVTSDGGRTWTNGARIPFAGAVYGSAYAPESDLLVAVGPGGAAYSTDDADSWTPLDSIAHWSVAFGGPTVGWMAGPQGRISKITF